jgi:hypothetical protein
MGPYTNSGGEHPYGHTALSVTLPRTDTIGGETGRNFVFDFGRYGNTWGVGHSEGEGMLRVWTDEKTPYINSEKATGRYVTGYSADATSAQSGATMDYFKRTLNGAIDMGAPKDAPLAHQFRITSDYNALGPNCTTMSADGYRSSFPNAQLNTDIDGGRLGLKERAALFFKGTPDHVFMPLDLEKSLDRQVSSGLVVKFSY